MSNQLLNDLNRLQRLGKSHSRTARKVEEAALRVAQAIAERIPSNAGELPRHYQVYDTDNGPILVGSPVIDGRFLHVGADVFLEEKMTFKAAFRLAQDLASGLLDELAQYMTERNAKLKNGLKALDDATALLAAR